jgi:polyisoprenoid-binding protein YceI
MHPKDKTMNRNLVLLAIFVLLTLGVSAAATYEYFIGFGSPDGTPPTAPTLEAANQQTVYRIDPAQSQVRYTVEELFLRENAANTAIGTTHGVAGDILIDFTDPAQSRIGTIVINIEQFESDSAMRDGRIRKDYLESSTYPEAIFEPIELLNFPADPQVGVEYQFQVMGDLTIKTATQPTTWEVSAMLTEADQLVGSAHTTILMSSYDVGPISLAGFVETEDEVALDFDFVALPSENATAQPDFAAR